MPTIPVRQSSFAGGEIAPLAYGRTDHPRYASSLRRMVNFFATALGAAKNRPGSKLVAATKGNGVARRIPFVFSSTQTYMLEFGNGYIRFVQNGGQVLSGTTPYEIASPFTTAMLPYLEWDQVGDVMTICYGGQDVGAVAPQELRRLGHTNWTIGAAGFAPVTAGSQAAGPYIPASGNALPDSTHPGKQWWWQATQTVRDASGNISETTARGYDLLTLSNYNAIVTYAAGAIVSDGVRLFTSLVGGNIGNTPATSPTQWAPGIVISSDKGIELTHKLSAPGGYTVVGINIYRVQDGAPGWLTMIDPAQAQYVDTGAVADFSHQPPKSTNPFSTPSGDYPSAVCFYEQRRVFARQNAHPQRIQGSRPAQYWNFDIDLFVEDDDAIQFDIGSAYLDEIRHLVSGPTMLALAQSGLWRVQGFQGDPLSPLSVNVKRDIKVGSSWVRPALNGEEVFFVRERGNGVSAAMYDGMIEKWRSEDLSILASHLFDGHTIVSMAFAREPDSILWCVRDDGLLIGVTRIGEASQGGVLAWHQHNTDGVIEDVCVVPEGTEDAVYLGVRRTINGATVRYTERLASRLVTDARLGVFLDSAITADGRNVGATTMKFTSDGATYAGGEEGVILASVATFNVIDGSDIGDQIVFDPDGVAGGPFWCTIISITDATHARAQLDAPMAAAFQNVATTSWGFARDSFSGLDHLEGKAVKVLADGGVQGPFTVIGGIIQGINPPAVIAQIGLAYQSILELLDMAQGIGRQKVVKSVAFELASSRGGKAGPDTSSLTEWDDQRDVATGYGSIALFTGREKVRVQAGADPYGRAVIVQDDPLPMTVVGVTREVSVGGEL